MSKRMNPVDFAMQVVLNLLGLVIRVTIEHLIPALFYVAVWITAQLMGFLAGAVPGMSAGAVVVLSWVGWIAMSLLFWPVVKGAGMPAGQAWLLLLGGGTIVGLTAGGTVARTWIENVHYEDHVDPVALFGFHREMFTPSEQADEYIDLEELMQDGVVLGEDLGYREHR